MIGMWLLCVLKAKTKSWKESWNFLFAEKSFENPLATPKLKNTDKPFAYWKYLGQECGTSG
ncbi:hypothetical protein ABFV44_24950, partial [Pseudomonas poae]